MDKEIKRLRQELDDFKIKVNNDWNEVTKRIRIFEARVTKFSVRMNKFEGQLELVKKLLEKRKR